MSRDERPPVPNRRDLLTRLLRRRDGSPWLAVTDALHLTPREVAQVEAALDEPTPIDPADIRPGSGFQLGQRVTITGTAVKDKPWEKNERNLYGRTAVRWIDGPPPQRVAYPDNKVFTEGVIVGSRTVQEGHVHRDYEEGSSFIPEVGSARQVWLVAFDLRMKPAMCFDYQLAPLAAAAIVAAEADERGVRHWTDLADRLTREAALRAVPREDEDDEG